MTRRSSVRALAGAALAILLLAVLAVFWLRGSEGIWGENATSGAYRAASGPVPATPQRPGDPAAGYRALVNASYVSCGLPYRVYERLAPRARTRKTFSWGARDEMLSCRTTSLRT